MATPLFSYFDVEAGGLTTSPLFTVFFFGSVCGGEGVLEDTVKLSLLSFFLES
jgi:hypothetical protein